MKYKLIFYLFLFLFISCKAQTLDEQMIQTTKEVLNTIKNNDIKSFHNRIASKSKMYDLDGSFFKADFKRLNKFYTKYVKDTLPEFVINHNINELGQKSIIVDILNKPDTSANIKYIKLILYFGPTELFSLSKISGYYLDAKMDIISPTIVAPPIISE